LKRNHEDILEIEVLEEDSVTKNDEVGKISLNVR
jgi:hypothetical protein